MTDTMQDEHIREALDAHWRASAAGDADAEHDIYDDNAICDYPQSGERIFGRRNLQALRSHHPGKPSGFNVRRMLGEGNLWVTEYVITYQGKPAYTVSMMEFRDGKVVHETQYFADPFEAPAWRSQWVGKMPKTAEETMDDPFDGRRPTNHEQMAGQPWDASYTNGPAPWDIGRPQAAIMRLASKGVFAGTVLDAGCGTGEHTLHIAAMGVTVLGVDVAGTALVMARKKAADRGIEAEFATADALHLERLDRNFDAVLDCGLFHSFEPDEQKEYATSLASVTKHDGMLYVLCFADEGPNIGPHPVHREDLQTAFSQENGWNLISIENEKIETRIHANGVSAWLVGVKRVVATVS